MADALQSRSEIEIRIGNVDLPAKLDALGAALGAIREAHRDTMSPRAWAALHRAQQHIAEAMLYATPHAWLPGVKPALVLPAGHETRISADLALASDPQDRPVQRVSSPVQRGVDQNAGLATPEPASALLRRNP